MSEDTSSATAVKSAPRLHYIDGLRACAMLMVLVYHCWLFGGMWDIGVSVGRRHVNLASVFGFGHIGVNLFLVLSGFCLYWPFVKAGGGREPNLWEFAKRRCRRILPPYYVALALFGGVPLVIAFLHGGLTPPSLFLLKSIGWHLVMLHNLRPEYGMSIDAPFWSLALEFQLYILFPLLVESYRRFNARGVTIVVFAVCTGYRFLVAHGNYTPDDTFGYVLAYSVFGRCFEFALGMYAARVIAGNGINGRGPISPGDYVFMFAVTVYAVIDGRRGHFQALTDAMWGLLFFWLLVAASRYGSRIHALLSMRWLVACGIFSYSVYLIHLPIIVAFASYADAHHFSNHQNLAYQALIVAPLAIVLGYLFHLCFEKPFMRSPKISTSRSISSSSSPPLSTEDVPAAAPTL